MKVGDERVKKKIGDGLIYIPQALASPYAKTDSSLTRYMTMKLTIVDVSERAVPSRELNSDKRLRPFEA